MKVKNEYPILNEKAIRILLHFSTTYLCETAFSAIFVIKTKQQNRLALGLAERRAITTLTLRIEKLFSEKEKQQNKIYFSLILL